MSNTIRIGSAFLIDPYPDGGPARTTPTTPPVGPS
jgi:hypothetical protein